MEIERKWMVDGWPEMNLPLLEEQEMRQGYLSVDPTVRIREERMLYRADDVCLGAAEDLVSAEDRMSAEGMISAEDLASAEGRISAEDLISAKDLVSAEGRITDRKEKEGSALSVQYILCLKSRSADRGLSREEIEICISEENFHRIEQMIGLPLIPKRRRSYLLPDGCRLEVNDVDAGLPTAFCYAEIEYESVEAAKSWKPSDAAIAAYLRDEVTGLPGQSMGAYWMQTRAGVKN